VVTVVVTLPLLTLGAEVTTKKVGMIDRQGVRSPAHMVTSLADAGGMDQLLEQNSLAWVIEHGHRTVGWVVGMAVIVLCAGLFLGDRRRWMHWMGLAAFLGVSSQGILGILRIELENRYGPAVGTSVALVHGCTAQLVLALLVSIALWTSGTWQNAGAAADAPALRRASLVLVGVLYLQIVFGAVMRHKELALGTRMHILLAFAVIAAAAWVGVLLLRDGGAGQRAVWILWGLLAVQLLLGLETLLSKFAVEWPTTHERVEPLAVAPEFIRSVHFLVGALTFSTAVAVALLAHRASSPAHELEGAL
jgi:cytochrome c oxidase assembly protein subunit 15